MSNEFTLIEKEDVASLVFPAEQVKLKEIEKEELKRALERAISLGNLERHKVKIYFEDQVGRKKIHTTIWGLTDTAVVLKQNVVLPIRRITKIEI